MRPSSPHTAAQAALWGAVRELQAPSPGGLVCPAEGKGGDAGAASRPPPPSPVPSSWGWGWGSGGGPLPWTSALAPVFPSTSAAQLSTPQLVPSQYPSSRGREWEGPGDLSPPRLRHVEPQGSTLTPPTLLSVGATVWQFWAAGPCTRWVPCASAPDPRPSRPAPQTHTPAPAAMFSDSDEPQTPAVRGRGSPQFWGVVARVHCPLP